MFTYAMPQEGRTLTRIANDTASITDVRWANIPRRGNCTRVPERIARLGGRCQHSASKRHAATVNREPLVSVFAPSPRDTGPCGLSVLAVRGVTTMRGNQPVRTMIRTQRAGVVCGAVL